MGVNPFIKSFLYNTYCLPKLTYGMGLYGINKQTRNILNVNQNNLVRYMLGIPYRTHIRKIIKVLNILEMDCVYCCQICIVIKLLHRHKHTKEILLSLAENNDLSLDLNDDIQKITGLLGFEKNMVIFYPDKVRKMLIENYFYKDVDVVIMQELSGLLQEYSFANKRKLVELIKININNIS